MTERVIGVESEYALSAVDARGTRIDQIQVLGALMRKARQRLPHLPDELARGMFLQNGSRFYCDCGGHPEVSTPECSNPWDVVRYIQAGESVLLQLVDKRTSVFRSNVCVVTGSSWGLHDNHMHRVDPQTLPPQIIPHLVSRIVYTGAGGFQSRSSGLAFTLSPRAAHIEVSVSPDSTSNRGIFHSKDEHLCDGRYHRLHILCGESLCSELATWLRVGATALVVALCEAGLRPGDGVGLRDPVLAMRAFADDPTCRATVEAKDGRRLSAVAIQRHYLDLAEAHVGHASMPPWAPDVCRRWRSVLDALDTGWESMSTTLDWAIKLALYRDRVRRCGVPWESLARWTFVVERLTRALQSAGVDRRLTADLALGRKSPIANTVQELNGVIRERGLDWSGLGPFLDIRDQLWEIDMRFGQLGARGIFSSLDAAGTLTHRVEGVDGIDQAVVNPPDVPRARLRGQLVRQLSGNGRRYSCAWNSVWDTERGTYVDLSDPFGAVMEWKGKEKAVLRGRFVGGLGLLGNRRERPQPRTPIELNQVALEHRKNDRLDDAERLLRQAIAIEDLRVSADSPKRPHRRNNLAIVLMRAGRLGEAVALNSEAWRLSAGRHDVTSGRILFVRIALDFLGEFGEAEFFIGQLKSFLDGDPLECLLDIAPTWDIPDVLGMLREVLLEEESELLERISATLNRGGVDVRRLEELEVWRETAAVGVDERWPGTL